MFKKLKQLYADRLFMNSIYLILASGIVAAFGFIFWTVIARGYDPHTVGIATTLISVSGLISLLSLAGFDTTLVRFLAKAEKKDDYINTGLLITAVISVVMSELFLQIFPLISPQLGFVAHNPGYHVTFIVINILTSWNVLTNAVFLSFRKTAYIFFINLVFSIFKITIPFFVQGASAMTIFVIAGIAQGIGTVLSLWFMIRHFNYSPRIALYPVVLKGVKKYSSAVYVSSVLNLLPPTLLPLIITNRLGPSLAAYYYIAFTIAGVLYTVAYSTTQSLFAEGSHDELGLRGKVFHAIKITFAIMLPVIFVLFVGAKYILSIFGADYTQAESLLRIFAVSGIAIAVYSIIGSLFKLWKNLRAIIAINAVYATSTVVLSLVLAKPLGLNGIGWGWLIGSCLAVLTGSLFLYQHRAKF